MKVLYIINNLGSGGAENLINNIIPRIRISSNFDIEINVLLLTQNRDIYTKNLVENGVEVIVSKFDIIYDPRNIFEISKIIKNGNYDIVHVHTFPAQLWSIIAKFISNSNIKFITTEHSTSNRRRNIPLFKLIDKLMYSGYDTIISVSEYTQINLIEWIKPSKHHEEKFSIIANGIDVDRFENAKEIDRKSLVLSNDKELKLVCMVGRFSNEKDQKTLIRSMQYLPISVNLLLIGDGNLIDECKAYTDKLKLSNRVHFLGFRSDVDSILKSIDIVVLSSVWEGFGLAALEGMAANKPVIVSNVNGLKQILNNEELTFEPGDEIKLSQLIERIIENEEFRYAAIAHSKLRKMDFDINITVKNHIELYNRLFLEKK